MFKADVQSKYQTSQIFKLGYNSIKLENETAKVKDFPF